MRIYVQGYMYKDISMRLHVGKDIRIRRYVRGYVYEDTCIRMYVIAYR